MRPAQVDAPVGEQRPERRGEPGVGRDDHSGACRARPAISAAWSGPAPPKATRSKSRGSTPRSTATRRIVLAIPSFEISITAAAAATASSPIFSPSRASAACARPASSLHAAAQKGARVDPAEDEVRVGHGGLRPAEAVAGGPRDGPGASRADAQHPAVVDPGDRPAAGADRDEVDAPGVAIGSPNSSSKSGTYWISPSRTSPMSALVPPILSS